MQVLEELSHVQWGGLTEQRKEALVETCATMGIPMPDRSVLPQQVIAPLSLVADVCSLCTIVAGHRSDGSCGQCTNHTRNVLAGG